VVYFPERFRHLAPRDYRPGGFSNRMVGFIDLAPTMLSIAGLEAPAWMQGRAFAGSHQTHSAPESEYLYGFRGRMDERYDLMRTARDERYVYVRNYMPHRPYGQHVDYMFVTNTTAVWKKMFDAGELKPPQTSFWETKPTEELYDLQTDKWEVHNLADSPSHRAALEELRKALDEQERATRDVGFMPEYELHRDEKTITAYERGRDPKRYDFDRVYATAQAATDRAVPLARVRPGLADKDPIVRYWAATGMLVRGKDAVAKASADLAKLLDDPEPGPQIVASEALARYGAPDLRKRALDALLARSDASRNHEYVAMLALNALNQVTDLPEDVKTAVGKLPTIPTTTPDHIQQRENYLPKLVTAVVSGIR
jgi:uncharacterized sulfatase